MRGRSHPCGVAVHRFCLTPGHPSVVNNKLAGTNVEEVRQKCSDAVAEINDRVRELALAS